MTAAATAAAAAAAAPPPPPAPAVAAEAAAAAAAAGGLCFVVCLCSIFSRPYDIRYDISSTFGGPWGPPGFVYIFKAGPE